MLSTIDEYLPELYNMLTHSIMRISERITPNFKCIVANEP